MRLHVTVGPPHGGFPRRDRYDLSPALHEQAAVLADADVEAPDLGLYLPHAFAEETPVGLEVPVRVTDACDLCGECTSICQFNAIKKLGGRIMPFSDMCHGCGGCTPFCHHHISKEILP